MSFYIDLAPTRNGHGADNDPHPSGNPPLTLANVDAAPPAPLYMPPSMRWLGDALGGQIIRGGIHLLAGQPGSRKSGLTLQLALELAARDTRSLFIMTEEPAARLRQRAEMLTSDWSERRTTKAWSNIHVEDRLISVDALPGFLVKEVLDPAGSFNGIQLLILDSIQGRGLPAGTSGSYRKLHEATRLCQQAGITTFLVGHVNKRGEIAGPRNLEHHVDVVLMLRRALGYRPLFIPKNRFGPAMTRALPLELDSRTTRLKPSAHRQSATSIAKSVLYDMLVDVQAAVSLPASGGKGKVMTLGLPRREVEQLMACLSQVPGVELDGLEFTIHCRLPGGKRYVSTLGLPLCMALLASYLQRPLPQHHFYLGEVDLRLAVRDLPDVAVEQLTEVMWDGQMPRNAKLLCPPRAATRVDAVTGVEAIACPDLQSAISHVWPDVHLKEDL